MSNEVTNADLMDVLMSISKDFGELKNQTATTAAALKQHVEDDKAMLASIQTLQLTGAKQKGFLTALASFGGILGAGLGYVVERVLFGGSHSAG